MRAPTRSGDLALFALMLALAMGVIGSAVWFGIHDSWDDPPARTQPTAPHRMCGTSPGVVQAGVVVGQKSAATPSRTSCSR